VRARLLVPLEDQRRPWIALYSLEHSTNIDSMIMPAPAWAFLWSPSRSAIAKAFSSTRFPSRKRQHVVVEGSARANRAVQVQILRSRKERSHHDLKNPRLPILSNDDVLAAGPGYGLEGCGIGKSSGVELVNNEKRVGNAESS
jgi:hypothetical protein